jgi:hypothetical protein
VFKGFPPKKQFMNKLFGILILPETNTVHDVDASAWTIDVVRQKLQIGNDDIVERQVERTGDVIFVSAFLNSSTAGKPFRCDGFDLYGERFYGPALIVSGEEGGASPILDPHDISRVIHFFRISDDVVREAWTEMAVSR